MRGGRLAGRRAGGPVANISLAALALLAAADRAPAQTVPPDERYLAFDTPHFRIVFPARQEELARRAAGSAEWAYAALTASLIDPPSGRISLIIGDNSDLPNAAATPLPSNRIVLIATPQILSRQLDYYDDWLDVAITHELTHIFHLDRAAGLWRVPRLIFGRAAPFFPAFYQPTWLLEGLATYYESRLTGTGRANGGYFRSLLAGAAFEGGFNPVYAANGLVPEWPGASTPYAYGGLYVRELAAQHGDTALASFVRHAAARFPFTIDWAATRHFDRSLSAGWEDWRRGLESTARARADSLRASGITEAEPLTGFSWSVPSPRFSPDGRRLAFAFRDPREDPATVILDARTGVVVASWRRNSAGGTAWAPDGRRLYFDQLEFADRYSAYGDLYLLDVSDSRERRLSRGARLLQPDVAADGRVVAVQVGEGTNRLVLVDDTGAVAPLTTYSYGVNWARPRWSPAAALIAAERWERGRPVDIALLDSETGTVIPVTDDAAADVAPTWSPDGRYLLWSSDREGIFEIYAAEVREPVGAQVVVASPGAMWRVTRTVGGALDPAVAPDGSVLIFAAEHDRGFRLERTPFDPSSWEPATLEPRSEPVVPLPRATAPERAGGEARPYSPFPSLWPTGWLPVVTPGESPEGWLLAAQVLGNDDVGRHAYALQLGWRTGVEDLEALIGYSYRGLGDPILRLGASQTWDGAFAIAGDGTAVELVERERELRVRADFLRPRVRSALAVSPSVAVERRHFFAPAGFVLADPTFSDLEAALGLGFSTARTRARSIGPGAGFVAVANLVHERLADDLDRWRVTGELELTAYRSFRAFGFADHVLAARLAVGASEARNRGPELFDLGGVPGQALVLGPSAAVGGGERYHLRGYAEATQLGDRVAAASLEYRLPIVLVGRGHGLWPVLLDHLSAALFVDAGSAWLDSDAVRILASSGAELVSEWGLGYSLAYRFRAGVARRLVRPRAAETGWQVYAGVGLAF